MERNPDRVRQQGYIPLARLLEINRDAIRAMTREESHTACKILVREIIGWCSLSNEEAVGLLESAKTKFLMMAEDNMEHVEVIREKREARRIT
jgi:hypothetical protein